VSSEPKEGQPGGSCALTAGAEAVTIVLVSHPDPNGAPDLTPIEVGEVWENPVTAERATILEAPWQSTRAE
jgi:hypothetical protein